ncbi:ester cyclase [Nocardia asteroides]|uniref:ester cyclase n=1 Tax=Nocardia asteroides TaxID=1824 RepID=UPI00344243F3
MATHDNPGILVRRMVDYFNNRQFDKKDELFAPDFFNHALGTTGSQSGKNVWQMMVEQYPDIRLVIDDVLVDGDRVAIRTTVEGVPLSGNNTRPMLIEIFHSRDGRLTEMWGLGEGLPFSAETFENTISKE